MYQWPDRAPSVQVAQPRLMRCFTVRGVGGGYMIFQGFDLAGISGSS